MSVISQRQQLTTRVASCLKLDKRDQGNLHVEIDAIIQYLADYDIVVPPAQYEKYVVEMLNNEVVNKLKFGQGDVLRYVANMLIELAENVLKAATISGQEAMVDPVEVREVFKDGQEETQT